jgi:hypothetical protein
MISGNEIALGFIFFFLIVISFLPGVIELFLKKDIAPLFIRMDYSKDPFYFGQAFKKILFDSLTIGLGTAGTNLPMGFFNVRFSKKKAETICIVSNESFQLEKTIDYILLVKGNLLTNNHMSFSKECYVTGDALIGTNNIIRALKTDGNIYIKNNSKIERWIDGEKDMHVGLKCNLGINACCRGNMLLSEGVIFKRLFARQIGSTITHETFNNSNVIKGHIKAVDSIVFDFRTDSCIIDGNIICENNINLSGNIWVKGNIFSQKSVRLVAGVIVGEPGKIKSVIGKKRIILGKNTCVYGYLLTDGYGRVV